MYPSRSYAGRGRIKFLGNVFTRPSCWSPQGCHSFLSNSSMTSSLTLLLRRRQPCCLDVVDLVISTLSTLLLQHCWIYCFHSRHLPVCLISTYYLIWPHTSVLSVMVEVYCIYVIMFLGKLLGYWLWNRRLDYLSLVMIYIHNLIWKISNYSTYHRIKNKVFNERKLGLMEHTNKNLPI